MGRIRRSELLITRRGDLAVERDSRRPSGRLLRQGLMEASYVDLADPRHLEFDYMRWMRLILRAAGARRVLHIGGGACALARALAAEDRESRQEVCEVDREVLELARAHMGLRRLPGLRVRLAEGRAFLAAQPDASRDACVIDAFSGVIVPRSLVTVEALAEAARVAPLTMVNVVDDRAQREVRTIAAAVARAYPSTWAVGGRLGNTVVIGAATPLPLQRISAQLAADSSPPRLIEPEELRLLIEPFMPLSDAQAQDLAS